MTPQPIYGIPVSGRDYTNHLREKRRRLEALCEAAKLYLSHEMDSEIAELEKRASIPIAPSIVRDYPGPNLETLSRAQTAVESLEHQIEQLDAIEDSPIADVIRPLMDAMYRPMLQSQLESATRYRDDIQHQIESRAKEAECPQQ